MKLLKRTCVMGWRDARRRDGFVVRPERDHESVTSVDARRNPGIKASNRALRLGQPLPQLDFEPCCRVRFMGDTRKYVTRQQAQSEPVRVVEDDRVVDRQVKR